MFVHVFNISLKTADSNNQRLPAIFSAEVKKNNEYHEFENTFSKSEINKQK
jgi:hypothetical protein